MQGSIAWAISLVTFPYVSVPAYWVLGRYKFNGYVIARRQEIDGSESIHRASRGRSANLSAVPRHYLEGGRNR